MQTTKNKNEIKEIIKLPPEVLAYINSRSKKNIKGGKSHFLHTLVSNKRNPIDETLNILERAWIKGHGLTKIGKDYNMGYFPIWRLIKDLTPYKDLLIAHLQTVPRRKTFFNRELEISDYENVRLYIARARRDELRAWKNNLTQARKVWKYLKRKDPAKWKAQEIVDYLATLSQGAQSSALDGIRRVAPHLKDEVKTGRYREKLRRRKKDLFGKEFNMIRKALKKMKMPYHLTIMELHVTLGAREGATNPKSGMVGITWDRFKKNFSTMDLYESKVRGGIIWSDCPIDLFFADLPAKIRALWEERGKPITDKFLQNGYKELLNVYKEIRTALTTFYDGKLEPSLFKELTTLRPHDADKIHVNLLWEAKVPLEVVAGQYIGRGEGIGLMGRGWLDINTIKKHYLSLTQRSERFQALKKQVTEYSHRFNGGS